MVTMECAECKEKNYFTSKNKRNTAEKLELKKRCKRCGKVTKHKEGK